MRARKHFVVGMHESDLSKLSGHVQQGVCHRDLKLENTLLDGRPAPRLKICDFGYSKVCACSPVNSERNDVQCLQVQCRFV